MYASTFTEIKICILFSLISIENCLLFNEINLYLRTCEDVKKYNKKSHGNCDVTLCLPVIVKSMKNETCPTHLLKVY